MSLLAKQSPGDRFTLINGVGRSRLKTPHECRHRVTRVFALPMGIISLSTKARQLQPSARSDRSPADAARRLDVRTCREGACALAATSFWGLTLDPVRLAVTNR